MFIVLSDQNNMDSKFETEELATDLMSAIKEFEETTAKIQSAHQKHESYQQQESYQNQEISQQQNASTKVCETTVCESDDKGPIDYFIRTKQTLRHVPLKAHDINNNEQISEQNNHRSNNDDGDDNDTQNAYVKIPVQQLINTFEKQMRTIIKQKINENIQVKLDGTACSKNVSTNNNRENSYGYSTGKENETKSNVEFDKINSRSNMDMEQIQSQQQQLSNRIEHQSQSIDQQYQWSTQTSTTTATNNQIIDENQQNTLFESTLNRFSNSNDVQLAEHFDGGKA